MGVVALGKPQHWKWDKATAGEAIPIPFDGNGESWARDPRFDVFLPGRVGD